MVRIAVFDSGLGSLSIIKPIQKKFKCEIIYFADQHNFPYGNKTKQQLETVIKKSITFLKENYAPDIIIMGSNTPSLVLDSIESKIIKVTPPLIEASRLSKTNNIGILATKSTIHSQGLKQFINKCKLGKKINVHYIDASLLINLVEYGKFIDNKTYCKNIIQKELVKHIIKKNIDVVTLSSTHLPFLKPLLENEFSNVIFLDPANSIAEKLSKRKNILSLNRNRLKIITTGNPKQLERILIKQGISNKVSKTNFL